MNKLIRLKSQVVVAAALAAFVTGCNNIPLLGRNQSANQAQPSPGTTVQPANRTAVQRNNQPGTQAQNNQPVDGTINPEAPNTGIGPSDTDPGVPALW